jgi:3-oxoacyl-[acyl-carrier protein] reductase
MRGQIALVTGGTSGIGRACVEQLAEAGAKVWFTFNQAAKLADEIEHSLTKKGYTASAIKVDLTSDPQIEDFTAQLTKSPGRLDFLVTCSGIIKGIKLSQYSFKQVDEVFAVNVLGTAKLIRNLIPILTEKSSIVVVSSISAYYGSYDPIYSASKAALTGLTKSLARELGPKSRVNSVAPGLTVGTGMFRSMVPPQTAAHEKATFLKKLATPQDIAGTILFLCSQGAAHITGACIDVNGGEYLR